MLNGLHIINSQISALEHYAMLSTFEYSMSQSFLPQLLEYLILEYSYQTYIVSNFEDNVMLFILSVYFLSYTCFHNQHVVNQVNDLIHYPLYWQHYSRGAINEPTKILIAKARKSISNSYVSSPTTNVFSTPWYLELVHFIFWFFIFMMFFVYMWLTTFQHQIIKNNENNNLIRETRGFSRSQAGDAITGIVPMTWSISMIMHANLHSINFDDNTSNVRLKLTLIAYQWGWSYFFPKDLLTMSQQFVIGRDRVLELENPKYDYKNLLLREMRSGHSSNRRPYFVDNLSDLNYTPTTKAINSWNCFNNTVYNNYPKKHKLFNEHVNFANKVNIAGNYFFPTNPFSIFKSNVDLLFGSFNSVFTDYLVWNQLSYYLIKEYNIKINKFVLKIFETMKFFDKNEGFLKLRPKRIDKRERKKVENPERAAKKLAKENKKKKKRRSFTLLNDWTKKAVYKNTFVKKDSLIFDSVNNFKEKLERHYVVKRYLNNVHTKPLKDNPFFNKDCSLPVVLKNINCISTSVVVNKILSKDVSQLGFFFIKNNPNTLQTALNFKTFSFFLNNPINVNYLLNTLSPINNLLITNLFLKVFFNMYVDGYIVISSALRAVYTPLYVHTLCKIIPKLSFNLFILHQKQKITTFYFFDKNLYFRHKLFVNYLYMNFSIFTNFLVCKNALNIGFNNLHFAHLMKTFKLQLSNPILRKVWNNAVSAAVFGNNNNPNPKNTYTLMVKLDCEYNTLLHLKIIPEVYLRMLLYLISYRSVLHYITNPNNYILNFTLGNVFFIFSIFLKQSTYIVGTLIPSNIAISSFFAKIIFHNVSIIYYNRRILGFITYSLIRSIILKNLIAINNRSCSQYLYLLHKGLFFYTTISYLYTYLNFYTQNVSSICAMTSCRLAYQVSACFYINHYILDDLYKNILFNYHINNCTYLNINKSLSALYLRTIYSFFEKRINFFTFVLDFMLYYNLHFFINHSVKGYKNMDFVFLYIIHASFIKNLFNFGCFKAYMSLIKPAAFITLFTNTSNSYLAYTLYSDWNKAMLYSKFWIICNKRAVTHTLMFIILNMFVQLNYTKHCVFYCSYLKNLFYLFGYITMPFSFFFKFVIYGFYINYGFMLLKQTQKQFILKNVFVVSVHTRPALYTYINKFIVTLDRFFTNNVVKLASFTKNARAVKHQSSITWSYMHKFTSFDNRKNKFTLIPESQLIFNHNVQALDNHAFFNFYIPKIANLSYFNQPYSTPFDGFYNQLFLNKVISAVYAKNMTYINSSFVNDYISLNQDKIINNGFFRSENKYTMFKDSIINTSNNGVDLDMMYLSFKYTPELSCARSKWGYYRHDQYLNQSTRNTSTGYVTVHKNPKTMLRFNASNIVCLPAHTDIHLICASKDVIHSWAIPGLGIKVDCIPGFNSHKKINLKYKGTYYGQCMEVCGRYHHWMPLIVKVTSFDLFLKWYVTFLAPHKKKEYILRKNAYFYAYLTEEDTELIDISDHYLF